jgi:hypothetical protein
MRGVFQFNAPKAGTAQVTFHGSLVCRGPGTQLDDTFRGLWVEFDSQIVSRTVLPISLRQEA